MRRRREAADRPTTVFTVKDDIGIYVIATDVGAKHSHAVGNVVDDAKCRVAIIIQRDGRTHRSCIGKHNHVRASRDTACIEVLTAEKGEIGNLERCERRRREGIFRRHVRGSQGHTVGAAVCHGFRRLTVARHRERRVRQPTIVELLLDTEDRVDLRRVGAGGFLHIGLNIIVVRTKGRRSDAEIEPACRG